MHHGRHAQGSRGTRCGSNVLGFTLIEVLAALVIVSLGMLGVIQAVSQTAGNSTYLREKTIAHWVAMNRLTEARLQPVTPKIDKTSDDVEMAGRQWRWTMEVTQTPVESVRRIDVRVRAAGTSENSSLAFVTGFYGAAIAPAGSTLVSWQGAPAGGGPGGRDEDEDEDQDSPPEDPGPGDPGTDDQGLPDPGEEPREPPDPPNQDREE